MGKNTIFIKNHKIHKISLSINTFPEKTSYFGTCLLSWLAELSMRVWFNGRTDGCQSSGGSSILPTRITFCLNGHRVKLWIRQWICV